MTVLVLKRPVSVGQELRVSDVREASIARNGGIDAVPAEARGAVEGRSLAYSLPAGAVLTKSVLGSPKVPRAGQAVAAVGLKLGQFPTGLQPGHRVMVVAAAPDDVGDESAAVGTETWKAVVAEVRGHKDDQVTVVTLQLAEADARRLAAAPEGTLRLVVVRGGR
ncbi:SAF domain-containing protein [Streptomyces sp. CC224B]|uniref:SAF domain-containing protein n=1 Tax=Streptomyces sp. CC224B TaxID=3044571 RepID=UPI0024A82878|nr:SAF domain-containing protein [Streptomyces sp. CC224B]